MLRPLPDELCKSCGGRKSLRNPTGKCDHLHWPDNLTDDAKIANGYAPPMRVLIRELGDGTHEIHSDKPITAIWVNEECTDDRVYQHSPGFVSVGTVDAIIGNDNIGFHGDGSAAEDQAYQIAGVTKPSKH